MNFIKIGLIPLDNSIVERTIRPFATNRKSFLFSDVPEGADANATMYSLIQSAKINNLNIPNYFEYLLTELPKFDNLNDDSIIEKYLPWSEELPEKIKNCQSTNQ